MTILSRFVHMTRWNEPENNSILGRMSNYRAIVNKHLLVKLVRVILGGIQSTDCGTWIGELNKTGWGRWLRATPLTNNQKNKASEKGDEFVASVTLWWVETTWAMISSLAEHCWGIRDFCQPSQRSDFRLYRLLFMSLAWVIGVMWITRDRIDWCVQAYIN